MSSGNSPAIGVTLDYEQGGDHKPAGGYSYYPWYALRTHYADAIVGAGGLPFALPHEPDLASAYLDRLDALVITGGAFDVDPSLYGGPSHPSVTIKQRRTEAEMALLRGALARHLPVLGICGGQQLLAVALGGTLITHIPDAHPDALPHEQPNPRHEAGHAVTLIAGTLLARIAQTDSMTVNSSHHQAVADPGPTLRVNARAPDGIVEGVEHPRRRFCLGVQWHPEFLIDPADRLIFDALIAACA